MPRKRKQNETQPHKIYVLLSSISNEFFVGKTTAAKPNVAYKFHAAGKHTHTKKLFEESRKSQIFPKMYLLEEINVTPTTAFGYCVAWTKYFIERGLSPLTNQTVLDYTEELTEENETVFNCIKAVPIEAVLSDEHLLIESYKVQKKKTEPSNGEESPKQKILLHLTPENYELLSYKAKEAKMSMSKYCQLMAINGAYTPITVGDYLNEMKGFKITLKQIFGAFLQRGKYYPADIVNIQKLVERVEENQEKVCRHLDQEVEKLIGYKKLKLENYRLKKEVRDLKQALKQGKNASLNLPEGTHEDNKN